MDTGPWGPSGGAGARGKEDPDRDDDQENTTYVTAVCTMQVRGRCRGRLSRGVGSPVEAFPSCASRKEPAPQHLTALAGDGRVPRTTQPTNKATGVQVPET